MNYIKYKDPSGQDYRVKVTQKNRANGSRLLDHYPTPALIKARIIKSKCTLTGLSQK